MENSRNLSTGRLFHYEKAGAEGWRQRMTIVFTIVLLLCIMLLLFIVKKLLNALERILKCFVEEVIPAIKTIVAQQEKIAATQTLLHEAVARELELIRGPLRSLVGTTEQLRQRMERLERKRRGEDVPELKERPRTIEENHQVKETMGE